MTETKTFKVLRYITINGLMLVGMWFALVEQNENVFNVMLFLTSLFTTLAFFSWMSVKDFDEEMLKDLANPTIPPSFDVWYDVFTACFWAWFGHFGMAMLPILLALSIAGMRGEAKRILAEKEISSS